MGIVVRPGDQMKLGPDKKNTKVYKGIKQISDYNEFNDYENVVNDLDEINWNQKGNQKILVTKKEPPRNQKSVQTRKRIS